MSDLYHVVPDERRYRPQDTTENGAPGPQFAVPALVSLVMPDGSVHDADTHVSLVPPLADEPVRADGGAGMYASDVLGLPLSVSITVPWDALATWIDEVRAARTEAGL